MLEINPIIHMDSELMWYWYYVDAEGETSFSSSKKFFSREDCRRDHDVTLALSNKR